MKLQPEFENKPLPLNFWLFKLNFWFLPFGFYSETEWLKFLAFTFQFLLMQEWTQFAKKKKKSIHNSPDSQINQFTNHNFVDI